MIFGGTTNMVNEMKANLRLYLKLKLYPVLMYFLRPKMTVRDLDNKAKGNCGHFQRIRY